uniref:Uncharacterized protein n=1 Tax=Micrurus lemniscatus lemniscatus TaxID=129467 RepID=A0A2D4ICQ8_MICLE
MRGIKNKGDSSVSFSNIVSPGIYPMALIFHVVFKSQKPKSVFQVRNMTSQEDFSIMERCIKEKKKHSLLLRNNKGNSKACPQKIQNQLKTALSLSFFFNNRKPFGNWETYSKTVFLLTFYI